MSDLKHRTLPELKSFVKKYKEHFKLNVSKVKKDELLKRIDNGMLKAINPALQKGLKEEYEKLKQPKDKKAIVKKRELKKKLILDGKPPPMIKPLYKSKKKIKVEKPKEKNIEQTLKEHSKHHTKKHMDIMKKEIKKGKTFNQAHKTALKEEPKKKVEPKKTEKKPFGIDVETMNRKKLKEQAENIGVYDDFATDDELRKKIKDEIKRIEEGNAILCSSEIKRLLNDLRDILSGNEKYAEIAKGYGKEKLKYADYRKKFIEGANEILKNHKKYKRQCTEGELTEIRKGLKIMEDSPNVQKFNKRTPLKN